MIQEVKQIIKESEKITVLSGINMMEECGFEGLVSDKMEYEVEEAYGYTPQEILTEEFYHRRTKTFYDFYRRFIIDANQGIRTSRAFDALARLNQSGKVEKVITRMFYGLHQSVGINNVIELAGNINDNYCPKCGKRYSANYFKNFKGLPVCEHCGSVVKPGVTFYGGTVGINKITESAEAVAKSDVLLLLGCQLDSRLAESLIQYYEGEKMILINHKPRVADSKANYALYGNCSEILPQIID